MKIIHIKYIIALAILFSSLDCDKDNHGVDSEEKKQFVEYRTKYTGNFTFKSYRYRSTLGLPPIYYDTVIYQGNTSILSGNDSLINVEYRPSDSWKFICNDLAIYGSNIQPFIRNDGVLLFINYPPICHVMFSGSFISPDSIYFEISNSSVGGEWGQIVAGKRI